MSDGPQQRGTTKDSTCKRTHRTSEIIRSCAYTVERESERTISFGRSVAYQFLMANAADIRSVEHASFICK